MSILIDENTRLLIQGITGRQALMNTLYMREYGTKVIAGTRPGKGGQYVEDIPIYNTVREAKEAHPELNSSAIYVPPHAVKDAVREAIESGIKLIVITSERTPHQDLMELAALARGKGARIIGPNSIGIISPEKSVIGLIGARVSLAKEVFIKGPVGVISRSGGQVTTCCHYLSRAGIGQSTALCIGGDAFVGTRWDTLLELFEDDPETKAVIGYGEIGTSVEEEAAELIKRKGFSKPFIAYIAGMHAGEGQRFGHAGAIIKGEEGKVAHKKELLQEAGAVVVDHFHEVAKAAKKVLRKV
jgi:succinyl-CoA synthetase alpha subunit